MEIKRKVTHNPEAILIHMNDFKKFESSTLSIYLRQSDGFDYENIIVFHNDFGQEKLMGNQIKEKFINNNEIQKFQDHLTQLKLESFQHDFENNPVLDGVFLEIFLNENSVMSGANILQSEEDHKQNKALKSITKYLIEEFEIDGFPKYNWNS